MPTARQHTIILHGGSRGAKSSKTDLALKHYREVLENRVKCIMAETAKAVYNWQVPGTFIVKDERPRWSGAFRADWHVHVGGGTSRGEWEESVAETEGRYPWQYGSPANEPGSLTHYIEKDRAEQVLDATTLQQMGVDTPIYVCNVSPYARWLNYGTAPSRDKNTFLRISPGYHFMAACEAFIRNNVDTFIDRGLAAAAKKPARG